MSTSISAGLVLLCRQPPLFAYFFFSMIPIELKIPNFSLNSFVYFFGNIIMNDEPAHTITTSKERMAPELMFHLNLCHSYQLLIDSKVKWPLRFAFSYV